ncbi:MAG: hypothetical protein ACKO2P_13180, partial [Planctomycetota bacterium]
DVAATWSDDEVARRWWVLFPQRRTCDGRPEQPTSEELNHIKNNAAGLADKRRRLSSVSWFMKCISEPIAKRANRDDQLTGHFWEARFKVQPLLDETAIAACMAYVDLNPIRAAVAQTPEASEFTSVRDRIADRQAAVSASSATAQDTRTEHGVQAGWLAPIPLEVSRKASRDRPTTRRLTNRGCLFMTLDQYLQLVDWTGRQLRLDKPGQIPEHLAAILMRLDCSLESWLDLVRNFRRRFPTEAGRPETLQAVSQLRRGCRRSSQRPQRC